jgi:PDZ domain
MTTWHSRMLVAAGWLWMVAANAASAAPPSNAELRAWLGDLDAEEYAAREQASERLVAAGEAAIDALADGVDSTSPEAAWRASAALEQIALNGNEATLSRVTTALERLSQNGKSGLAKLAQELHAKQARLRRDRAVAKVRSLGGQFSGEGEEFSAAGMFFGGAMPAMVEVVDEVVAEKVAEDIKILAEAGDPAPPKRELEIPAELKTFDEALKFAEAGLRKPAEPNEKDPPPPPDAVPVDVPAPPAIAEAIAVPPAEAIPAPPPAIEGGIDFAIGEIFIADAAGIDLGFDGIEGGEEVASESLALDAHWSGGDAGLAVLRDLPNIVSLSIIDAKLTDAALPHVAALPRLASLELHGTAFTAAGLHKFRQQRPTTRIFARGDAMLGVNAEMEGPCVLSSVYYGSGAYEAGLAQGDEIVKVDGLAVADFSDLTIAVFTHKPGEKLKVEFKRGGQVKALEVLLKDRQVVEPGRR